MKRTLSGPPGAKPTRPASLLWTRSLATVGAATLLLLATRVYGTFLGPIIPYTLKEKRDEELDSEDFLRFLSIVTGATIRSSKLTRLKNGSEFYPAELTAIRAARYSVNLEFYEFKQGKVATEMLAVLCQRARAGVQVRILVDAVGSLTTRNSYFDELRAAGGQMFFHHPLRWNTWQEINNRTHRKLMVVDGEVGFIGGAGIADHWLYPVKGKPAWRDTVFRVDGEGVAGLTSTFSENWLEASGEILSGKDHFTTRHDPEGARSIVVASTPHGGGTRARILLQVMVKSARKSIQITTPYFLPDRSARQALIEAIKQRGVKVRILTAGPKIDHPTILRMSRHASRRLIEAGAEIYEYQPAMVHAKLLTIDEQWNVVGSTNFDHRSFALNDEVNMAVYDPELAATLRADFQQDLASSHPLTLEMLAARGMLSPVENLADKAMRRES